MVGGPNVTSLKGNKSGQHSFTCVSQNNPGGHWPKLIHRRFEVKPAAQLAVIKLYNQMFLSKMILRQNSDYNLHPSPDALTSIVSSLDNSWGNDAAGG